MTVASATDALLDRFASTPEMRELVRRCDVGGSVFARGIGGSSATLLAGALQHATKRPILLVFAHLDDADEAVDELESHGVAAERFPAVEISPGETGVSLDLVAERLLLARRLDAGVHVGQVPALLVAPISALMQTLPAQAQLNEMLRTIRVGDRVDTQQLAEWLISAGYIRLEAIESPGDFAIRGGIIDLFPHSSPPVRIDLFGDEVERLNEIDLDSMGSDRAIEQLEIVGATLAQLQQVKEQRLLIELLPPQTIAILVETLELTEQGRSYYDRAVETGGVVGPPAVFKSMGERCGAIVQLNQISPGEAEHEVELPIAALPGFSDIVHDAVNELAEFSSDHETIVFCQNEGEGQRMRELLAEHAPQAEVEVRTQYLHRGFIWQGVLDDDGARAIALVPYHELLHRFQMRRRIRRVAGGRAMDTFLDLQVGDYVVHRDHGIAKFTGLQMMRSGGGAGGRSGGEQAVEEFLTLEFAGSSKLHVPATKIELIQKYIGAFRGAPELSVVGGRKWKNQKEKVREAVEDLAAEMLRLQAARESMPGVRYPADTPWQHEFEAEFPYEETDDQLAAIAAFKRDMMRDRPMDRLVCGDVGFGKTEVAIRAAFKAVEYGKQVAVLVPTTVLAEQHERTFRGRFADYPFRVESLSRFKSKAEQTKVLLDAAKGQVDILIGTHRILSKDVKFMDLGLVIIDEEQRFGVEHKQRLLSLRATADIMTLSATPIPRTLHMAMLGLRDISSLSTPPLDRRAIVTEVMGYNKRRVKQAIERELAREGQVYYVHNRVHNIESVADDVRKLVPGARIIIGHGQMPPTQLERVMTQFTRGQADILVCTTIIESGIDIPTANTMVIHDAHRFGLAELHQLRGRVGRHKHRAYCYLILPQDKSITETAMKRLQAIENFSMLGAGFKIAMRDLEIRGAGNLLGPEQSGHISTVGYEMYCQLLEEAVRDLKHEKVISAVDTVIDIGVTGSLPKGYIPSDARRLDAYRRLSQAATFAEIEKIEHDLVSAYGDLPKAARLLLEISEARIGAAMIGVRTITRHEQDIIFRTTNPRKLEDAMRGAKGTLRMVGSPEAEGVQQVYYRPPASFLQGTSLVTLLRRRLRGAAEEIIMGL